MVADMYDKLGLKCGRTDGMFGVEIEVEGKRLPRARFSKKFDLVWKVEQDGSLRGEENAEYVFRKPLSLNDTKEALSILDDAYIALDSDIDDSVRAGVHTHLNIQRLTPIELMTFATAYYMLEDYFVHWAGPGRVGNHFCLRSTDAEDIIYRLIDACKNKDWRHLNTNNIRYASMNWNAIHKYGSLEFRAMRSTRNMGDIYMWVKLINQLMIGSAKFNNPREVIGALSEFNAANRFIEYIMGDLAPEFTRFTEINIWDALENVQPIAYMIDWDKFNKDRVNPFLNRG